MSGTSWINDEDYIIWLWQTSFSALERCPAGTRPFAEAAVHALLATLRAATSFADLRERYHAGGPESLNLIRSLLPFGPGAEWINPLSDADFEWLLILEDAAYYLRYCEISGLSPEVDQTLRRSA